LLSCDKYDPTSRNNKSEDLYVGSIAFSITNNKGLCGKFFSRLVNVKTSDLGHIMNKTYKDQFDY
jgi:hypothetical protein